MRTRREDWFILACAIVVVILVAIAIVAVMGGKQSRSQPIQCLEPQIKDKIRELMLDALDLAFKDHVAHTFEVWMKDDRDQPQRASVGVRKGVRAYEGSRLFVLKWNPPSC